MRILQIGPIPPEVGGRTGGGVATHLWALAANLVKEGHTVGALGDNYYPQDVLFDIKDGIHLFGLIQTQKSVISADAFSPGFWRKILRTKNHFKSNKGWKEVISGVINYHRVIEQFKPDIIHIHHLEYRFPYVYYLVEDRIPILTTVHSTSFVEFSPTSQANARKELIYRNLDLARNLIFVSKFLKKRFETLFPGVLEEKNTYIVHNPVNGSLYHPISKEAAREKLGIGLEGSVILFVGKLIPQKGLDILIEAAKLLKNRDLSFKILVVGTGPEREELDVLVQKYELAEQIRFEGVKSQQELFLYYNAADLFALPSAMESFGLVFVEAMLCGCPVMGRAEVLMEILPSERCGYYLPSASPDRWADVIAEALAKPWAKDEIHGLSRAYSWEVFGDRFEKIYQQVLI